jgi:5-hydroxyisourate hydrolase
MSHVTTHVLDAVSGTPAVGLAVALSQRGSDGWDSIDSAVTDADGRVSDFGPDHLEPGVYRVHFDTGMYFSKPEQPTFYPEVTIVFEIIDGAHYHVPLLLSPFAYSTYRGS